MKGLAAMVAEKVKSAAKKKEPVDSKSDALKKCIEAINDGDVEGAAKALGVAISACQSEYEAEPDDDDEE